MSLPSPFQPPVHPVAPVEGESNSPPPCKWLLPLPEDAERGTKPEVCDQPAPFQVRVKDAVSDALVDVCARHKQVHHERAANLRQQAKTRHSPRRKAG